MVVVGMAAVALLAAPIWGHRSARPGVQPTVVVVQPGESLASIVAGVVPPRHRGAVEADLRRELGSDTVVPGERLVIP